MHDYGEADPEIVICKRIEYVTCASCSILTIKNEKELRKNLNDSIYEMRRLEEKHRKEKSDLECTISRLEASNK